MELTSVNGYSDYLTEDTALRSYSVHPNKRKRCCHHESNGFTIIIACFSVLTFVITIALIIQIHFGRPEVTPHAAVASDDAECSLIGANVLFNGGNAVDATIATLLCMSVVHPHVVGLGGGGIMLIHDHPSNKTFTIDFMSSLPNKGDDSLKSVPLTGGQSIATPGFLKGLEYAHHYYGKLSWSDLVLPSVKLARRGFIVSKQLEQALKNVTASRPDRLTTFDRILLLGGFKAGRLVVRDKYAEFLEGVVSEKSNVMTSGIGLEILNSLNASGAYVQEKDFLDYQVAEMSCNYTVINNMTIHTSPIPYGGSLLLASLQLLSNSNVSKKMPPGKVYISYVEAYRKSYSYYVDALTTKNGSETLVDPQLWSQNQTLNGNVLLNNNLPFPYQGATQVTVMDTFDLYVASVAGLGSPLGSRVMTDHGILFNNHRAFSLPQTSQYKRPFAPFAPIIVTDATNKCGHRLALASPEVDAVLQVVSQFIFMGKAMIPSIQEPRIIIPSSTNKIFVEDLAGLETVLSGTVRNSLNASGLELIALQEPQFPSVNGISKFRDSLSSHSDTRGGGLAARLEKIASEETNEPQTKS